MQSSALIHFAISSLLIELIFFYFNDYLISSLKPFCKGSLKALTPFPFVLDVGCTIY
jgi:hypothetical protein